MIRRITADAITTFVALGIMYIGVTPLVAPTTSPPDFGLAAWTEGDVAQILNVKGVRDIVSGIIPLTLLALGERNALGWVLLCESLIALADGTLVLVHGGSAASAIGVHYSSAVIVLIAGILQLGVARRTEQDRG